MPYTTWDEIREKRSEIFHETDWTDLEHAALTEEQKTAWQNYRQSLRDLPQNFQTPEEVVFPEAPVV